MKNLVKLGGWDSLKVLVLIDPKFISWAMYSFSFPIYIYGKFQVRTSPYRLVFFIMVLRYKKHSSNIFMTENRRNVLETDSIYIYIHITGHLVRSCVIHFIENRNYTIYIRTRSLC